MLRASPSGAGRAWRPFRRPSRSGTGMARSRRDTRAPTHRSSGEVWCDRERLRRDRFPVANNAPRDNRYLFPGCPYKPSELARCYIQRGCVRKDTHHRDRRDGPPTAAGIDLEWRFVGKPNRRDTAGSARNPPGRISASPQSPRAAWRCRPAGFGRIRRSAGAGRRVPRAPRSRAKPPRSSAIA